MKNEITFCKDNNGGYSARTPPIDYSDLEKYDTYGLPNSSYKIATKGTVEEIIEMSKNILESNK